MDMKIVFMCVAGIVISIRTEVNMANGDCFAAIVCRKLPIDRNRLYQFVTFPETVDKVSAMSSIRYMYFFRLFALIRIHSSASHSHTSNMSAMVDNVEFLMTFFIPKALPIPSSN